ncbi:MAG: redoxin domain-containing protein [Candidatus Dadabacteria bacterium]
MRIFTIFLLLVPSLLFSQGKPFEIFGSITGEYHSKMYLFFDANFRQRDSLSSEIKDGKFYFKGTVSMPVLARISLDDQNSFIADFYIDHNKTYVSCTNKIKTYKNAQNTFDSMNLLQIVAVKGSRMEDLKLHFTKALIESNKTNETGEEKKENYYQKLLAFVKEHPESRLSPYLVSNATDLHFQQVKKLSNLYDPLLNDTYEGNNVSKLLKRLDRSKRSLPGIVFHDFDLKDSSGHQVNTKQLHGKATLLVFWASWCGPCRAEHPELNKLYEKYKSKGLEMVGISIDEDSGRWVKAIVADRLQWPQLSDLQKPSVIGDYYGLVATTEGIPFNVLLDKDGKIVDKKIRISDLEKLLEKLL